MKIKELTIEEFTNYSKMHPLSNYMQSAEYAKLMGENKYNFDFIGLINDQNKIVAASLILWKKMGLKHKFGYAPKGFLVNYYDETLIKAFTNKIIEFYSKKNVSFIKINPEIVVGEVNSKTFTFTDNPNMRLKQDIQRYGYLKLKDNLYFESLVPRFNAYVNLKTTKFENYSKTNRNKVNNSKRKGLYTTLGTKEELGDFLKIANVKNPKFYSEMYEDFSQSNMIDLILIKADFENFIKNSQSLYEKELDINGLLNEILHRSHKPADLNSKMASDSRLCIIKNEIMKATEGLREYNNVIVAGALVIKHNNRVHIVKSGYDKTKSYLNANYFLYDALINNYKNDFDFLDLNGVSGDFKKTSPYYGLNHFKLGFNPAIYEYIGEFDLVINRMNYEFLLASGKLAQELNKK